MIRYGRTIKFINILRHASYPRYPLQNWPCNLVTLRHYSSNKNKSGSSSNGEDCIPPGGIRNPVQQIVKKPNVMNPEQSSRPCGPKDDKKIVKTIGMMLAVAAFASALLYALGVFDSFLAGKKDTLGDKGGGGGGGGGSGGTAPRSGYVKSLEGADADGDKKKKRKCKPNEKHPSKSKHIPNEIPYLLIGGGTAAFTAFRSIKSLDPTAKVLVITNENYMPYMRPPLSKEMWFNNDEKETDSMMFKQWNGSPRSIYFEPDSFYMEPKTLRESSKGGVAVARGWTVTEIDPFNRQVTLDDGYKITYGKCLVATGSTPKILQELENSDKTVLSRLSIFKTIFDFQDLHEVVKDKDIKSVTIVGGGFLGSELACALARYGHNKFEVNQVFKEPGILGKVLPEYLSLWTSKKVEGEGVNVISDTTVTGASVNGDGQLVLSLSNGKTLQTDHCVIAVGSKPDTKLAASGRLETDAKLGGYLVNAELEARSHLYIAGDAACFYDVKLGRRRVEHHDHAVVSGRLAGENMVGAGKPYLHQSMFWSDLGPHVGFEAIGVVDSSLPTVGVFAKQPEIEAEAAKLQQPDAQDRKAVDAEADSTPKAAKHDAGETAIAVADEKPTPPAQDSPKPPQPGEDYQKGVIFYLNDDVVVGVLLWNVFNRMQIARQVLSDERKYDDLNEVAKLFNIHEE